MGTVKSLPNLLLIEPAIGRLWWCRSRHWLYHFLPWFSFLLLHRLLSNFLWNFRF
jgi:hypothetical protein